MDSDAFDVLIEPGGIALRVSRDANVLGVALAAGLPLPHSCRAGRCASCKSRLLSGEIQYPDGVPPGITAAEIARGEVLLCQARPRSDLRIEIRRVPAASGAGEVEFLGLERIAFGAKVNLGRPPGAAPAVRAGQFIDLDNLEGTLDRVVVIAVTPDMLTVEIVQDSALVAWFENTARPRARLRMTGPFEGAR